MKRNDLFNLSVEIVNAQSETGVVFDRDFALLCVYDSLSNSPICELQRLYDLRQEVYAQNGESPLYEKLNDLVFCVWDVVKNSMEVNRNE